MFIDKIERLLRSQNRADLHRGRLIVSGLRSMKRAATSEQAEELKSEVVSVFEHARKAYDAGRRAFGISMSIWNNVSEDDVAVLKEHYEAANKEMAKSADIAEDIATDAAEGAKAVA